MEMKNAVIIVVAAIIILSLAAYLYGSGNPAIGGKRNPPTITILNSEFKPSSLSILPGTKVVWLNEDGVIHQIQVTGPENKTSDFVGGQETFNMTFNTPGTYQFTDTRYGGGGTITVS